MEENISNRNAGFDALNVNENKCEICEKVYKSRDNLKKHHIVIHNNQNTEKNFLQKIII